MCDMCRVAHLYHALRSLESELPSPTHRVLRLFAQEIPDEVRGEKNSLKRGRKDGGVPQLPGCREEEELGNDERNDTPFN